MRALLGIALLASLASCAPQGDPWGNPPVSIAPQSGPRDPQPPGSLPPGAAVNAPLATPGSELLQVGTP